MLLLFSAVPRQDPILTINHTVDDMVRGFMIFMRGIDITWGIGRVLLKVEPVLGPGIARAYLGPLNGTRRQPSAILGPKYQIFNIKLPQVLSNVSYTTISVFSDLSWSYSCMKIYPCPA